MTEAELIGRKSFEGLMRKHGIAAPRDDDDDEETQATGLVLNA